MSNLFERLIDMFKEANDEGIDIGDIVSYSGREYQVACFGCGGSLSTLKGLRGVPAALVVPTVFLHKIS